MNIYYFMCFLNKLEITRKQGIEIKKETDPQINKLVTKEKSHYAIRENNKRR